jgi:adenine deaminase
MIEDALRMPLRQLNLAPSCVPSSPGLEHSGAEFGAKEIGALLDMDGIIGTGEMMDFPGVCGNDERIHSILWEALSRGKFVQGHCPLLLDERLAAYSGAGIENDHECSGEEETRQKLRGGMHVNVRCGTIVNDLDKIFAGCRDQLWRDGISLCTDDVHAGHISKYGHINYVLSQVIAQGLDPVEAIRFATYNAAREYRLEDVGAVAPGYLADLQLVKRLDGSRPSAVFVGGKLVAENGRCLIDPLPGAEIPKEFFQTIRFPPLSWEDFRLEAPKDAPAEIKTLIRDVSEHRHGKALAALLPVVNGCISIEDEHDLQYLTVWNRYGLPDHSTIILRGFGLTEGALASTISHDCHNFTCVYKNPHDAAVAAKVLKEKGGGICIVKNEKILAMLSLPVAGLLSPLSCDEIASAAEKTQEALDSISGKRIELLAVTVFSLATNPVMAVTDMGVVDGPTQRFRSPFYEG